MATAPSLRSPGMAAPSLATSNDPNNIFAVLTGRMGALELNQSLTNNWLTVWQNQTGERLRKLTASHEESKKVPRETPRQGLMSPDEP